MFQAIAFWGFASILIASAAMVVFSRNPVHSVLFLILAFFNAAGLFILLGAEFVALILVIVYVGAVAVLFLFVVMMLDINFRELRQGFQDYLPIGLLVGVIFLIELGLVAGAWALAPEVAHAIATPAPSPDAVSNTHALGQVLYTRYLIVFQAAGLILLVAMMGAIVLTLRHRAGVRRQSIAQQIARRRDEAVTVVNVPTGSGI